MGLTQKLLTAVVCLAVHDLLSMIQGVGRMAFPEPVGCFEHVLSGGIVAAQAFGRYLPWFGVGAELDQLLVVGHVFRVAARTVHRSPRLLAVAFDALLVVGRLEPEALGVVIAKRFLVAGAAANRLLGGFVRGGGNGGRRRSPGWPRHVWCA